MISFLDSIIEGVRCQNPNCRKMPDANNPVTVGHILYGGWKCECGWEYAGALEIPEEEWRVEPEQAVEIGVDLADPETESIGSVVEAEVSSGEVVALKSRDYLKRTRPAQPKPLDKMNRGELVAELDRRQLLLNDVPVSGRQVTNGDIRDYIIGKGG